MIQKKKRKKKKEKKKEGTKTDTLRAPYFPPA